MSFWNNMESELSIGDLQAKITSLLARLAEAEKDSQMKQQMLENFYKAAMDRAEKAEAREAALSTHIANLEGVLKQINEDLYEATSCHCTKHIECCHCTGDNISKIQQKLSHLFQPTPNAVKENK